MNYNVNLLQDFCATVVIAVFWLSASAAWANGLTGLKNISEADWIFKTKTHPCYKTHAGTYIFNYIKSCEIVPSLAHSYAGANISVVKKIIREMVSKIIIEYFTFTAFGIFEFLSVDFEFVVFVQRDCLVRVSFRSYSVGRINLFSNRFRRFTYFINNNIMEIKFFS